MRAIKRTFCAPVSSLWNDPANPTGHEIVPSETIRPDVGSMVPATMRSRLDLPAPLRPISATARPVGKVAFRLLATTVRRPSSV